MTAFPCCGRVSFLAGGSPPAPVGRWIQHWTVRGEEEPWMSAALTASGYLLRMPGIGEFEVVESGRAVLMTPCTTSAPEILRQAARDQIVPLALSVQSPPVLHASAVVHNGKAIVMVGPSGAGKSTLAAALCRAGASLLADDFVPIVERDGELVCEPTASAVWLHSHVAATFVQPVSGQRGAVVACAPGTIYVLDGGGAPDRSERVPLRGRDAVVALFSESYRIDPENRDTVAREFSRLSQLVASADVFRLHVHRDLSRIDETVRLLMPSRR